MENLSPKNRQRTIQCSINKRKNTSSPKRPPASWTEPSDNSICLALQQILSDERKYKLSRSERDQLSLELTIAIAQARQNNGRREDPNARFIAQVLGLLDTPFELIER